MERSLHMKNVKRLAVLFLSLLLCCCVFLTGCGNKQLKAGTVYKLQTLTYVEYGTEHTVNIGQKYNYLTLEEDTFIFIIEEDTAIFRSKDSAGKIDAVLLTWTRGYEKNEFYFWYYDELDAILTFDKKTIRVYIPEYEYTLIMKKA